MHEVSLVRCHYGTFSIRTSLKQFLGKLRIPSTLEFHSLSTPDLLLKINSYFFYSSLFGDVQLPLLSETKEDKAVRMFYWMPFTTHNLYQSLEMDLIDVYMID